MTHETKITAMRALSNMQERCSDNLENAIASFNETSVDDTFAKRWANAIDFWSKELKNAEKAYDEILHL